MRSALIMLVFLAVLVPVSASAEDPEPAPDLGFATDPDVPVWAYALTTDVLAPVFSTWVAEIEIAATSFASLRVTPSLATGGESTGYGLEVGAFAWPLADGLEGPYVGPAVGIAGDGDAVVFVASAEAGWQFVWGGLVVGLGAGASWVDPIDGPNGSPGVIAPRIRAAIGWAWM